VIVRQRKAFSNADGLCTSSVTIMYGPGDAGKFVGERDRQHVVVQSLLGGLDPGLEPAAFPAFRPFDPTAARVVPAAQMPPASLEGNGPMTVPPSPPPWPARG
jgi:hypothetical protein